MYLVPPVSKVTKTLKHMAYYNCQGVLVVPYWPSSPFWVYLVNVKGEFKSFVKDYLIFDDYQRLIVQGPNTRCFIGSENFQSAIVALKLDFETCNHWSL